MNWLNIGQRMIKLGVRSFVPGDCAISPAKLQIDLLQHLAEGEYAVEPVQVEAPEFVGRGDGPVMGVVKQQDKGRALRATRADLGDKTGRIPLVDKHEIGAIEGFIEVERSIVLPDMDQWEQPCDFGERLL